MQAKKEFFDHGKHYLYWFIATMALGMDMQIIATNIANMNTPAFAAKIRV